MNTMTFEQAMQWMREHREKNAYKDLTAAIRQALADDEDEDLGKYVIGAFAQAKEGLVSPEKAARNMFAALVGWDLESLVQHIAENEEWSRKENEI